MSAASEEDDKGKALQALTGAFGGGCPPEIQSIINASSSLTQLIGKLRLLSDASLREDAQQRLLESAEKFVSTFSDQMADLMDWVTDDPLLGKTRGDVVKIIDRDYSTLKAAAEAGKSIRNNKRGYLNKVRKNWGDKAADSDFVQKIYQLPEGRLRALADASARVPKLEDAQERISAAFIDRLTSGKRGIRNNPDYMAADFARVREESLCLTDERKRSAQKLGLQLKGGWVVHAIGDGSRLEAAASPQPLAPTTQPRALQSPTSPTPQYAHPASAAGTSPASPAGLPSIGSQLNMPSRPRQQQTAATPSPGGLGGSLSGGRQSRSQSSPLSPVRSSVIGSPPSQYLTDILQQRNCACRADAVSRTFIAIQELDQEPPSEMRIRSTLAEVARAGTGDDRGVFYCWHHTQAFCRMVGLRIHEGGHALLLDRLERTAGHRSDLERFKTSKDHYAWFRFDARGSVPADELGPYRFFPRADRVGDKMLRRLVNNPVRIEVAKALGLAGKRDEWLERGTLSTDAIFEWWREKSIAKAVSEEFDMYFWHLRAISDKSNLGWQREQLFSVSQQLMRQDPGYWLAYTLLREDSAMWLVSYPYYTKNTRVGDNTSFRHIDLNINDMADGKGISQIQGSLSLTDEDRTNCTILVPGMHKNIKAWRDRLRQRKAIKSGFIQKIDKDTLTPQDLTDFKTAWEVVPCKKFQVRITRPEIPHGSTGPSKSVRQTMLPWYVRISDDHRSLEIPAAGTFEEVALSHRDQTAPPKSPSGHANMYGPIPYKFPAGVQLEGLGPISDALVGRKRWDDAEVQYEIVQLLIGKSAADIKAWLASWRKNAAAQFLKAWEKEKRLEKFYFQGRAWGNRDKSKGGPPPPDFAPGDAEVESGEGGVEMELGM